MRLVTLVPTLLLVAVPATVVAQVSDAELNRRVAAAQEDDAGLPELVQCAAAARSSCLVTDNSPPAGHLAMGFREGDRPQRTLSNVGEPRQRQSPRARS